MNVWMNVILTMEQAVQLCPSDSSKALMYWDDAVAFYRGIGASSGKSYLAQLEHLAWVYSHHFGTHSQDKKANVNQQIQEFFGTGQKAIIKQHCSTVEIVARKIQQQMTVPLVQGLLFHAYEVDLRGDEREIAQAEAATFGAALLPMIHDCSPGFADLVHYNTKLADHGPSFEVIKGAVERQYSCLGITCQDVGGIKSLSSKVDYVRNAAPCQDNGSEMEGNKNSSNSSSTTSSVDKSLVIALSICVPVVAFLLVLLVCRRSKKSQEEKLSDVTTETFPEVDAIDLSDGGEEQETKVKEIV